MEVPMKRNTKLLLIAGMILGTISTTSCDINSIIDSILGNTPDDPTPDDPTPGENEGGNDNTGGNESPGGDDSTGDDNISGGDENQPGNENLVIGDYGEKARSLFENEKISEGHYLELLSLIQNG